jgi:hypothetical protein
MPTWINFYDSDLTSSGVALYPLHAKSASRGFMNAKPKDGHQVMPYPLRLPPALREQLALEAARNQRSLNGEIVFRLQQAPQPPGAQA